MAETRYIGPFRVGELINNQYTVVRLLGEGGHAHVYECHDNLLDTVVAIKVIASATRSGQELFRRARAEAQVMFRLTHPNVVKVHSAIVIDDAMLGIVMEKLEGLTLRTMLTLLGRMTVLEALTLVRQIAVAVGAAHKINVIHRDIKPENVFVLPPDNTVKVLDFGIAKFIGHGLQTTNKDRLHGTPLYMSPEHLQAGKVTPRSDIYQLGTVLFELIAGVNPCLVGQDVCDVHQIGIVQIARPTPPLSSIVKDVSPGIEWLIQRATAKDPNQRFATMDEMVESIDKAIAEHVDAHPQESRSLRFVDDAMIGASMAREPGVAPPVIDRGVASPLIAAAPSNSGRPSQAPTIEIRQGLLSPHAATPIPNDSSRTAAVGTSPQLLATSLVATSEPAQPRRLPFLRYKFTVPVLFGLIAGLWISVRWRQNDDAVASTAHLDRASAPATPSQAPTVRGEVVEAVAATTAAISETASPIAVAAPSTPMPSRPRLAANPGKSSAGTMRLDGLQYKPNLLQKPPRDERARVGSTTPAFNEDLERKLKAAGKTP